MKQKSSSELKERRIGILGTGRVACALLAGLREKGVPVAQLLGRDRERLEALGEEFDVTERRGIGDADPTLDILLIAVSDDAIEEVSRKLPPMQGIIAHSSGTRPLESIKTDGERGVFYPLQSFSSEQSTDWKEVPICIEASSPEGEDLLKRLGEALSDEVHVLGDEERKQLHLAAVIACNFSNQLFGEAYELLQEKGIPFRLLKKLILHTSQRAVDRDPREVQTGPAARGDRGTMNEHLGLLKEKPELQALYKALSERIQNKQHGSDEL